MKTLIKIALLLIVGVIVYNYFLGNEEEKASSQKVFQQVKQVGESIGDLLKEEKRKFAEGKYDDAFDKLGGIYQDLKKKATGDSDDQAELEKLESRKEKLLKEKEAIEEQLENNEGNDNLTKRRETLDKDLKTLTEETTQLFKKIMSNNSDNN